MKSQKLKKAKNKCRPGDLVTIMRKYMGPDYNIDYEFCLCIVISSKERVVLCEGEIFAYPGMMKKVK